MDFLTWLEQRREKTNEAFSAPKSSPVKIAQLREYVRAAGKNIDSLILALHKIKDSKTPYFHLADEAASILRTIGDSSFTASYMEREADKDPVRYVKDANAIIHAFDAFIENPDAKKANAVATLASALEQKAISDRDKNKGSDETDETELAATLDAIAETAQKTAKDPNESNIKNCESLAMRLKAYVAEAENFA